MYFSKPVSSHSYLFHQEARIPVPDERFEWLCNLYKPVSRIPAFLTCIDIAGLTDVRSSINSLNLA